MGRMLRLEHVEAPDQRSGDRRTIFLPLNLFSDRSRPGIEHEH